MKVGGEIQAAVTVMRALENEQVQNAISPDDSAQDFVDRDSRSPKRAVGY